MPSYVKACKSVLFTKSSLAVCNKEHLVDFVVTLHKTLHKTKLIGLLFTYYQFRIVPEIGTLPNSTGTDFEISGVAFMLK